MTSKASVVVGLTASAADLHAYDIVVQALSRGEPPSLDFAAAAVVASATAVSFPRAERLPLLLLSADNVAFDPSPGDEGGYVWLDDRPRGPCDTQIKLPQSCADAFEAHKASLVKRWLISGPITFDAFVWLCLRVGALAVRLDPPLCERLLPGEPPCS